MAERPQLLEPEPSESGIFVADVTGADMDAGDEPAEANSDSAVDGADAALAQAAAAGDRSAFDELYRRYSGPAWRVAYSVTGNRDDAADAVADAFTRILTAVNAGRLADVKRFGPYVMSTARNAAVDTLRRSGRVRPTDADLGDVSTPAATGPSDRLVDHMDASLVASAFRSLPERWRSVLWLTAVEGIAPADAAGLLGVSANGAAQLAVRARAGLRQRFLQAHLRGANIDPECRKAVELLGAYVGGGLAPRDIAKVDQHLAGCAACSTRRDELEDVETTLRRIVIPLPLALGALTWNHWLRAVKEAARTPKALIPLSAQRALTGASLGLLGLGIIGASIIGQSPLGSGPQGRPAAAVPVGQAPVLIAEAAAAAQPPAAPLPLIPGPGFGAALAAGAGTGAPGSSPGTGSPANPGSAPATSNPGGASSPLPLPVPAGTQPSGTGGTNPVLQLVGEINLAPAPVQITVGAGTGSTGLGTKVAGQSQQAGTPPPASSTGNSSTPSASAQATTPANPSGSSATVPPSSATTLIAPATSQAITGLTNATTAVPLP